MKNEEYKDEALLDGANSVKEGEINGEDAMATAGNDGAFVPEERETAFAPDDDAVILPISEAEDDNGEPFDPEIICDDLISHESESVTEEIGEAQESEETEALEEGEGEESGEDNAEDTEVSEYEVAPLDEAVTAEPELKKPRRVDSLFDFIEICIFTLASVFILMSFFFRYSIVDGNSMLNTLHDKERLVLTSFLYTPECGDIVVVQDKSTPLQNPIVKRVIAIGGQKVAVTPTAIFVNGEKLDEPYVYTEDYPALKGPYKYSTTPSEFLLPYVSDYKVGSYYEVIVPEGMIFVMGDHRNDSTDSREIGLLHEDAIIGKAIFRFYPFDKFGKIE